VINVKPFPKRMMQNRIKYEMGENVWEVTDLINLWLPIGPIEIEVSLEIAHRSIGSSHK
jgi:hypothetical protein